MLKNQKRQKTSQNSKKPKRIEKLLLGLIGSSIYVCSCKKMRYSVKTPLPNKRHKQTNKQTKGRSFSPFSATISEIFTIIQKQKFRLYKQ